MIEIVVESEGVAPKSFRFDQLRISIGRDAENDLVLSTPGCSRNHAEIVREGAVYRIRDLGSTNGLLVGGRKVTELLLSHGSSVVIGQSRLTIAYPGSADSEKTARLSHEDMLRLAGLSPERAAEPAAPPPSPAPPEPPAAAPPAAPPIYLVAGFGAGERILKVAPGAEYVIGRSTSADLTLDDREASINHAQVFWRAGRFFIRDLESSNGTLLNGETVREAPIAVGDKILLGTTEVHVEESIAEIADHDHLLAKTRLGIPTMRGEPRVGAGDRGVTGSAAAEPAMGAQRGLFVILGLVAALLIVVGGGWYVVRRVIAAGQQGTATQGALPEAEGTIVQLAPVRRQELVFAVDGTGSIQPHRSAVLSSEVAARVVELPVETGSVVAEGQLVAALADRDIRNQLAEARSSISRAQVQLAKEDYERKQRLFDQGALVRSHLDQSKANYLSLQSAFDTTQARIAQLQAQLDKTRIVAPFAGRVVQTMTRTGELVGPGSPVAALEDASEVLLEVGLSDRDIVRVSAGQAIEAKTDAFPDRVFRGVVDRLARAADPVTRKFQVEARISNPDLALRSGMIASLSIAESRELGLVVPAEAVVEQSGASVVFRVEGGVARRVEVNLGRKLDRSVEVLGGLAEGDQVVVYGHRDLTDGQAVRTQ